MKNKAINFLKRNGFGIIQRIQSKWLIKLLVEFAEENNINNLIEENYKSILKRGLITKKTTFEDFITKIFEEVKELEQELIINKSPIEYYDVLDIENIQKEQVDKIAFEMADVILVTLNFAKHYNIDIEQYLVKKININKNR